MHHNCYDLTYCIKIKVKHEKTISKHTSLCFVECEKVLSTMDKQLFPVADPEIFISGGELTT